MRGGIAHHADRQEVPLPEHPAEHLAIVADRQVPQHGGMTRRAPMVRTIAENRLLPTLRGRLVAVADPRRAPAMQAYMKSAMPFLGVGTPQRRAITRALWREAPPADPAAWRGQVTELWDGARYREELYAALDWCRWAWCQDRRRRNPAPPFHDLKALPLVERLIAEGAWWDLVDELASHQLGLLLRLHPGPLAAVLRLWAKGDRLWLRRAAILAQLDAKAATDLRLLEDCIAPSLAPSSFAREFFIAKGIGWALRQHARHDPAWVRGYLRLHQERLPALSRREAGKHL